MKGAVPRIPLRVSAGFGDVFILHRGGAVGGDDCATPSIPKRRFLLKESEIKKARAYFGSSAVGKALFTTDDRRLSCKKEDLWMVYMRYIIVKSYYFLTLYDTFLILWDESVS